jgi:hypothetical protein
VYTCPSRLLLNTHTCRYIFKIFHQVLYSLKTCWFYSLRHHGTGHGGTFL